MEKKTVVLYPGLAVSHLMPMMHLAGALVGHGYAVSVALIDPNVKEDVALDAVIRRVAASMPSVRLHTLPVPAVEGMPVLAHGTQFLLGYLDLVRRYNESLRSFLHSSSSRIHAVVVDTVSNEAIHVVKSLGIPVYTMFPSGAATLVAITQVPTVLAEARARSTEPLGETPLQLFGLPPMPASHLFGEMLEDPETDMYKATMAMLGRIPEPDGMLVNTFESLEARAVDALKDPRCLPGRVFPPVYCIGPFVGSIGSDEAIEPRHDCLAWLDGQSDRSVVFLCFGSIGAVNHSEEQLREMALGLDRSGHRFLWVVRADLDLDAILPDGFLQNTDGRGLVVKQWVPQVEVLGHRATGAFVTHCGWNSVLESVMAGVPMLCWPLFAEQKMNKLFMVGDMRVGVEMVGWQHGLVKATEVEGKIRLVMESAEGLELRVRVAAYKEAAGAACNDGGSSRLAFFRFLADMDNRQDQTCSGAGGGA